MNTTNNTARQDFIDKYGYDMVDMLTEAKEREDANKWSNQPLGTKICIIAILPLSLPVLTVLNGLGLL